MTSAEERVGPRAISQVRGRTECVGIDAAFCAAVAIGLISGMIGLGGAEFRLPLLIGLFSFVALQAVIVPALALLPLISAVKLWRH